MAYNSFCQDSEFFLYWIMINLEYMSVSSLISLIKKCLQNVCLSLPRIPYIYLILHRCVKEILSFVCFVHHWNTVKSWIQAPGLYTFSSTFWGAYIRRAFCVSICVSKLGNLLLYKQNINNIGQNHLSSCKNHYYFA